jgi:hypothetical protein
MSRSGNDDPKLKVDVGLKASASLEARVSTEIPAQSTGRFLDAITDIFRPFSERRGLKADQIRLQREEVLIEIARKAQERLAIEEQPPSPLPNKFLIPFLEKASLEEEGNVMIERWADLLASCSIEPSQAHPRFVQILSEMTADDARLLHLIALNNFDEVHAPDAAFTDGPITYQPKFIYRQLLDLLTKQRRTKNINRFLDKLYGQIAEVFVNPGIAVIDVAVSFENKFWSFKLDLLPHMHISRVLSREHRALSVLYSLHLLQEHYVEITHNALDIQVWYVSTTDLGVEFMRKCDFELDHRLRASARASVEATK